MRQWPIGVFTSLDAGLGIQLDVLSELDLSTIHLHAPERAARTEQHAANVTQKLADLGIEISCVFAGFPGESYADIPTVERTVGLVPEATRAERVEDFKAISDFAKMLKVDAVGLHLGFVPHDVSSDDYQQIVEMTRDLCDDFLGKGQSLHLETGQEPADVLLKFLQDVERKNLFVNFDPANMIMYGCGDPLEALKIVGDFVKSVHCKDARWSDQPGKTWGSEVPVGEGDVDFAKFLKTLDEIGYEGPLTIEREIPQDPARQKQEIGQAIALLNQLKLNMFSK